MVIFLSLLIDLESYNYLMMISSLKFPGSSSSILLSKKQELHKRAKGKERKMHKMSPINIHFHGRDSLDRWPLGLHVVLWTARLLHNSM